MRGNEINKTSIHLMEFSWWHNVVIKCWRLEKVEGWRFLEWRIKYYATYNVEHYKMQH